jgi:hypothetical protein
MGNATFDIIFEKPLTDMPGPDLIINESGAEWESYSVALLSNDNTTSESIRFYTLPSGGVDSCGNQVNSHRLDFKDVDQGGNAIRGIRIDNDPDKNGGAEISDITTVNFGPFLTRSLSKTQ